MLDYPGMEERARLADLVLDARWRTVALLERPADAATDAQEYAAALLPGAGPVEDVAAVVSFCMATPIAQVVAARVSHAQARPVPLVAVDGAPCPDVAVQRAFAGLAERYGASPDGIDVTGDGLRAEPQQVLDRMADRLSEAATATLLAEVGDLEVARTVSAELVSGAVDWLRHLVAAHNADYPAWGGELTLVNSTDALVWEAWPGARSTTVVTAGCGRTEVLAHPRVAEAVHRAAG